MYDEIHSHQQSQAIMLPPPSKDPFLGLNKLQAKLAAASDHSHHLSTGTLFAGSSEVVITHGAEIYRLRLTRQNKLILTK